MERRHLCKLSQKWNKTECGPAARTDSSWPLQSLAHFLCKCTGIIQTIGFWLHRWQKKMDFSSFDQTWPILNGLIIRLWKKWHIFGESFLWWKRFIRRVPRSFHAMPLVVLPRFWLALVYWRTDERAKPGINLAGAWPGQGDHHGHGVVLVLEV